MDNIDGLLEDLNSEDFTCLKPTEDQLSDNIPLISDENLELKLNVKTSNNTVDDYNATKKDTYTKYSNYGKEIHKKLKQSQSSSGDFNLSKSSWLKPNPEKSTVLSAPKSVVEGKVDVCAEPIFGLRLVNPLVSTQFIQSKMSGKTPVTVSNIANHLNRGDKNADWVFAGAIVFKSGMKTSQKGKQYCFWKISDLKFDLKEVTVYLFSNACSDLIKTSIGTVVAILNATPFHKEENVTKDDLTLTVRNSDQIMIWGGSRDYGICKAKKKNGENCTSFVNKSQCEFCVYHVKSEYNKFSSKRSDLFATSATGPNGLRNKVLGKSEVFYGGKTFSAIKAPKNSKLVRRDSELLNKLHWNPAAVNNKLIEADKVKLKTLSEPSSEREPNLNIPKSSDLERKSKKIITSRLHLFKEAGKKMMKTGETTRVSAINIEKKKKSDLSFANMFTSTTHSEASILGELSSKNISKSNSSSSDFIIELPSLNLKEKLCGKPKEVSGSPSLQMNSSILSNISSFARKIKTPVSSLSQNSKPHSSLQKNFPSLVSKLNCANNDSDTQTCSNESKSGKQELVSKEETSKFTDDLKPEQIETAKTLFETKKRTEELFNLKENQDKDSEKSQSYPNKTLNTSVHQQLRSSAVSANIHERKKIMTKMNAINLIKRKGGLTKNDPNRIKPTEKSKINVKRRLEEEDEQTQVDVQENSKPILSQRFIDLMNATSKHENLVKLAEDIEQQNYFNKMEKKEQLEEKMLNTYKIPCKAVSCLKCKYKWFSASDLCRAEGHPIKVTDAVKRFFKCSNCSNRTVSLEIFPLINCQNCGSAKWCRAAMIKEKIVGADNSLCIRGDEQKFLDSLSGKFHLNSIVPD